MSSQQNFDDDTVMMILLGILGLPTLLAAAAAQLPDFAQLLVQLQVLVSAEAAPALQLPGADGAGLDLVRLIPLASVLVITLVWIIWLLANRHRREKTQR